MPTTGPTTAPAIHALPLLFPLEVAGELTVEMEDEVGNGVFEVGIVAGLTVLSGIRAEHGLGT